jgi:hypothetical protein
MRLAVHLAGMGAAHNPRQDPRRLDSLFAGELGDFQLQILRHQLTQDNGLIQQKNFLTRMALI